jgi:eukaryotic-like serine/threonine-protein kinase
MLLHYRLAEKIGEGGMGIIWRALDTKLDREVAIKVLPEVFARDAERLARFEREAKLLAALNHPNIAAIYGLEHVDATRFLVLELVPGESLDVTLARGALQMDEALGVCAQIAAGVQAAHDQGILHRDLKPANIRRTPQGRVKVLDFGLGKALLSSSPSGDPMLSPTITHEGTIAGSILGTASYMSPEQARGKPLDRRSDVWSFGCILYESLAGQRAFPGETISDVIAKVIQSEPDWNLLPKTLPPGIRRLLGRCLQKDSERRIRDIGDARLEMAEALAAPTDAHMAGGGAWAGGIAGTGAHAASATSAAGAHEMAAGAAASAGARRTARIRMMAGFAAALVAGMVAGGVGVSLRSRSAPAPSAVRSVRVEMVLPPDAPLAAGSFINPLALSPDGRLLVYVGVQKGIRRLYLRDLNKFDVAPISGTEGAEGPFFSPDGEWVGFHADGKLKKVSVRGGLPQKIFDTVDFRGAAWGPDGTIAAATDQRGPLITVPAAGGPAKPLTTLDTAKGEWGHRFPRFLPGGRTVIYEAHEGGFNAEDAMVYAVSLDTGARTFLMRASDDVHYVPSGHLIYVQAGQLLAVAFDAAHLKVTGVPRPVGEGALMQRNTGAVHLTVSDNGTMIYAAGDPIGDTSELYWVLKGGGTQSYGVHPALYRWPRLSPDGRRIAMQVIGTHVQGTWLAPVGSEDFTKLTTGVSPIWSPSGDRVYFTMQIDRGLYWKSSDGSGAEEPVLKDPMVESPTSITPDGKTIAFTRRDPKTSLDIMTVATSGKEPPRPLVQTNAQEGGARFSPDGHYVAYVSDEGGAFEVYLMDYPGPGGRWQISRTGGKDPIWSADGHRLYYRAGDNLMSVALETHPVFHCGTPETVVEGAYEGLLGSIDRANYDVAPDGRILLIKNPGVDGRRTQVRLVLNFFEELGRSQ